MKASDEFFRNLFIHDQIESSMYYVATFWVSEKKYIIHIHSYTCGRHVENINANFQPIFLVNEPEKK